MHQLRCVFCVRPRSNFLDPGNSQNAVSAFIIRCSLLMMTFGTPGENDITVVHPYPPNMSESTKMVKASQADVGGMLFEAKYVHMLYYNTGLHVYHAVCLVLIGCAYTVLCGLHPKPCDT